MTISLKRFRGIPIYLQVQIGQTYNESKSLQEFFKHTNIKEKYHLDQTIICNEKWDMRDILQTITVIQAATAQDRRVPTRLQAFKIALWFLVLSSMVLDWKYQKDHIILLLIFLRSIHGHIQLLSLDIGEIIDSAIANVMTPPLSQNT